MSMALPSQDLHLCAGCNCSFPLKRLKKCGACRIAMYCSSDCQRSAWKDGHKYWCQQVAVQGNALKGWAGAWDIFIQWTTMRAFDLTNKPGNHLNHCLKVDLRKTGSDDLYHAYEVLDASVEILNVDEHVHFEKVPRGDVRNKLYAALLVFGEDGEIVDDFGLCWYLPGCVYDTPERSEMWAEHYAEVMKFVIANSKPRHAIGDAILTMETALRTLGRSGLGSVDAFLRGKELSEFRNI